jgi:hypothetical protein
MPNDSAAQAAMIPNDQAARDSLDQDRENSAIGEVVFLVAVLLASTVLLATGMFIASQPYRNTLVMGDLRILDYAFALVYGVCELHIYESRNAKRPCFHSGRRRSPR